MVQKFNVSMSPELFARMDEAAERMGVSRSSFIAFAVSQVISSQEITTALPEILSAVRQLQDIAAKNPDALGSFSPSDSLPE